MLGPVVITEAHLAFSGARTHSNNTAEMTAMIEVLGLVLEVVSLLTDSHLFFFEVLCMLLVFVWARPRPAHTCSWHLLANSL